MKALARWLARTKTTQTAFAKAMGVSQATISDIVNGVHQPSIPLLKRISEATGLSANKLLADDATPRSRSVA